jgi:hypothetical protein
MKGKNDGWKKNSIEDGTTKSYFVKLTKNSRSIQDGRTKLDYLAKL